MREANDAEVEDVRVEERVDVEVNNTGLEERVVVDSPPDGREDVDEWVDVELVKERNDRLPTEREDEDE